MWTKSQIVNLYEDYLDTLERCGSHLLQESDEEIAYQLFEQFDTGATSCLYEDSLIVLRQAGYIDDEMVLMSKEIRERWFALLALEEKRPWSIAEIKTEKEWQELFALCDRLRLKSLERPGEA